jgi:hypothetical protein
MTTPRRGGPVEPAHGILVRAYMTVLFCHTTFIESA